MKPEIWNSPDFLALDPCGKLAFFALFTALADDHGRCRTDAVHIHKVAVRDYQPDEIEHQLEVMENSGMVQRYECDTRAYLLLTNWTSHQRIDRPAPSRYPEPPVREASRSFANDRERSTSRAGAAAQTGSDRNRTDQTGPIAPKGAPAAPAAASRLPQGAVQEVFEAWRESTGRKGKLTDDRRRKIEARLREGFPVDELVEAVRGWRFDDWPERAQNNDVDQLLRSGSTTEKYRDLERQGPAPRNGHSALTPKARKSVEYSDVLREQAARLQEAEAGG